MQISYRQGILRGQVDLIFLTKQFLQASGLSVNIVVSDTALIATAAASVKNYLIREEYSVNSAWTGLPAVGTSILYWDINLSTGAITRGHFKGNFRVATVAPVAPGVPSAASFPGVPVSTPSVPAAPAAPAAAPAVIQNAPVQPWEQQAAAAPAVAPQVLQAPAVEAPAPVAAPVAPVVADPFAGWTPEQISTWVAQNPTHPLAIERAAQAAPVAPAASVAPVTPEPAAPAQPAWASAEVAPVQAAAAPAAASAPAVAEPAHPAQAAVPPWQVPAGTPAA